jgi:hypothetical protein
MKTQTNYILEDIIDPAENEQGDVDPVYYWVNLVPHNDKTTIIIVGECGIKSDKIQIRFDYISNTDTVVFRSEYRNCFCSPDLYEKYYNSIEYKNPKYDTTLYIPCIGITKKAGISVPLLIEKILKRIPEKILFL